MNRATDQPGPEAGRLGRLHATTRRLAHTSIRSPTREALQQSVCDTLIDGTGWTVAWVAWLDPSAQRLLPVARQGMQADRVAVPLAVSTEGTEPPLVAFHTQAATSTHDLASVANPDPWMRTWREAGVRSCAAVPLVHEGTVVGTITVCAGEPGAFGPAELDLLQDAAGCVAFALDSLAQAAELRRLTRTAHTERAFADTIVESTPGIVYIFDATGSIQRWNRNFERVSGYSADEIAQMHPQDFFAGRDRDAVLAGLREVFAGGESAVEAAILTRDGRSVPHLLTGRRVVVNGTPCLVGVGVDISQWKRAEERLAESERKYRELVEFANSIILRWDAEGRITFLNEFGQRFFGYGEEELLGRNVIGTIVPPRESSGRDLTQLMERVLADPAAFERNLNENMRRSGERVWVAWTNRIVRDEAGRIVEILSVGTDVTERRALEAQFLRAQRLESIGTLAGGIAHDLNNVLAPIMMAIEFMRVGETDPGRIDMLDTMEASARRGADMIRQVLGFARGVDGERLDVDVGQLVRDMAKIADETFLKTIEVDLEVDEDLWLVKGDPTQLHQVLMNLCVNARDAMPAGGRLRLSATNTELDQAYAAQHLDAAPGPYVVITVEDSGTGIPQHVLDRIFEPFFTTKEPGRGTGLGLSTSLAIVKSHGGFIHVYSEPGRGTSFHAYLPADVALAEHAPHPEANRPSALGTGQLVLVVDDERSVRDVTRRTLETFGYRVIVAPDGVEAISRFTEMKDQVAVVITDMMMPLMDGPALIQVLRRLAPRVRIIAVSGLLTEGRTIHAASLGVRHFLSKPYTSEQLLRALEGVLEQP